jgi:hypothetical protein
MPLTRISMTIPRPLVTAADRAARAVARSRSWLIAEALRAYLGRKAGAGEPPQPVQGEEAPGAEVPATNVAERVPRGGSIWVRTFDWYEDYLDWRHAGGFVAWGGRGTLPSAVCAALNRAEARYVVVGDVALQLWGVERTAHGVEILIEPTVENAHRVLDAVGLLGAGFARDFAPEQVVAKPVTLFGDAPRVDILTIAWSVRHADAVAAANVFEVEGVAVPAACLEHLIASKQTGKPRDAADLVELEGIRRRRGI